MNESGDRLDLKEELQLSGWVKGSPGMLGQPGWYKGREEGSYFHVERRRKVKRREGGREVKRERAGGRRKGGRKNSFAFRKFWNRRYLPDTPSLLCSSLTPDTECLCVPGTALSLALQDNETRALAQKESAQNPLRVPH